VNIHITNWFRGYAMWAAVFILAAAVFIALTADGAILPLVLFFVAAALVIFRYWDAITALDVRVLNERVRAKIGAFGIHEWYTPYHAAEHFCDPEIVKARNEATLKMNSIMMDMINDPSRNVGTPVEGDPQKMQERERVVSSRSSMTQRDVDYEAARIIHDQTNDALSRELLRQLIAGTLMAKGLPTKDDTPEYERIIPSSSWKIMSLNISKVKANGRGLHYIGIVIGKKPGR
jgi:hypothetical protein